MLLRVSLRARRRAALVVAITFVGFTQVRQCDGSTVSWTGTNSGWKTGTNWSSGNRPGAGDFAVLSKTGGLTATYDVTTAPFDVGSVLLQGAMTISQISSGTQLNACSIVIGSST